VARQKSAALAQNSTVALLPREHTAVPGLEHECNWGVLSSTITLRVSRLRAFSHREDIMRATVCVAKIALGLLVLMGGNLSAKEDWPMYGRNLSHTFSNEESLITPSNLSSLQPAWFFQTGDVVTASPTVVDGVVYVGSWDGYFYALDANSGSLKWKFQVDCQNSVVPVPPQCGTPPPPPRLTDGGLITSSAAVKANKVYFAGGKTLYSLNAKDGSLRWKLVICGNPEAPDCASDPGDPTRIFSSPAVFGGLVFVGHTVDGANLYRGGFEAIDAATGKLRWRFEVDPGGGNRGCGNVWSSAAVDEQLGLVFFGTGDCNGVATDLPFHEAVIALESRTGKLRWVFSPHLKDTRPCDFDFGASPNIIDLVTGRFLGIGGKDGTYYLLDRLTGEPVWQTNVVFGGIVGGFYGGAAFDGAHIFSATGVGDGNPFTLTGLCDPSNPRDTFLQEPSVHALNAAPSVPSNQRILWEQSKNQSFGATSLGNGVVFSGFIGIPPGFDGIPPVGPALNAYDAGKGTLLATFPLPGSVNSAATPVGNMLFVTTGNVIDGSGRGVHAFALP
jgi:outer membrane protein assembly factor BamB